MRNLQKDMVLKEMHSSADFDGEGETWKTKETKSNVFPVLYKRDFLLSVGVNRENSENC